MRSGIELSQFLRGFLPTLTIHTLWWNSGPVGLISLLDCRKCPSPVSEVCILKGGTLVHLG